MGDSAACLMRSFSHPSSSIRESQEGDPLRALTESISFGRFASESLAWEKWSTFSHNRYLEEVEQFSKPGSVAAKKAFFEAHYKKRAELKAAALLEQATTNPTDVTILSSGTVSSSVEEQAQNLDAVVVSPYLEKENFPKLEKVEEEMQVDSVGDMIREGTPIKESIDLQSNKRRKSSVFCSEQQQNTCGDEGDAVVSPKLEIGDSPKLDMVIMEAEVELNEKQMQVDSGGEQMIREGTPIKVLQSNKRRKSSASSAGRSETTTTRSTSGISLSAAAKQTATSSSQTKVETKKVVDETSVDRKRLAPKAVHMSINFATRLWETGKSSIRKSREHGTGPKSVATTKASVQGKSSIRTSMVRTKASVQGESKFCALMATNKESVHCESKIRTSMAAAKGSVQGESKIRASMAARQTDDKSSTKSSGRSGSKARPPLMSSPFSFRSEERAAKRKEMMEERNKAKEAESLQLQAKSKEKAEPHSKILRQSTVASRTRPNEDPGCRSQSIASHTRKSQIPLTRPRSPKLGRKPAVSSTNAEAKCRSSSVRVSVTTDNSSSQILLTRPRSPKLGRKPAVSSANAEIKCRSSSVRVSVTTDNSSSKHIVPKKSSQSTTRSSVSLLPKRKTQENASPNIQH
ncbi:Protein WVD2-like 7 [Linum perenne]